MLSEFLKEVKTRLNQRGYHGANIYDIGSAHTSKDLAKLLAIVTIQREALEQVIEHNAKGINGLIRGFYGNAEDDWRKAQAAARECIAACERIAKGE